MKAQTHLLLSYLYIDLTLLFEYNILPINAKITFALGTLPFIWQSCNFFDEFIQRTGAKPQTDRVEIVHRLCCLRSRAKKSHLARAASVGRPCGDCMVAV